MDGGMYCFGGICGVFSCARVGNWYKHPKMEPDKKRVKNEVKRTIDLVSLQQKYVLHEQADSKLKMYNFNAYLNTLLWTQRFKRKLTNG
mgnify:CR=1 FL=1